MLTSPAPLIATIGSTFLVFNLLTVAPCFSWYDKGHRIVGLIAEANLTEAGFTVDLQVMDWATLLTRRNDASIWEAFVT